MTGGCSAVAIFASAVVVLIIAAAAAIIVVAVTGSAVAVAIGFAFDGIGSSRGSEKPFWSPGCGIVQGNHGQTATVFG